jgi:hypothetical protein
MFDLSRCLSRSIGIDAALAAVLLFPASAARAATIPIDHPQTITQPGNYLVTQDIQVTGYDDGVLDVEAGDVDIDMNGHSFLGVNGTMIHIGLVTNVTIQNGRFSSGYPIISLGKNIKLDRIETLLCDWCLSLEDPGYVELTNSIIGGASVAAVDIEGLNPITGKITDNRIGRGFAFSLAAFPFEGGEISRNVISLSGGGQTYGLSIDGRVGGTLVENNVISGPAEYGALFVGSPHNFIRNNIVTGNDYGPGIVIGSDSNSVTGNTSSDSLVPWLPSPIASGFEVWGHDNVLKGNVAAGDSLNGLSLFGDGNLVEENRFDRNAGCGIFLAKGVNETILGHNSLLLDKGGAICGSNDADRQ